MYVLITPNNALTLLLLGHVYVLDILLLINIKDHLVGDVPWSE